MIEGVRAAGSSAQFLALSVSDAAEDVIGIIRAGARGYVTKSISAGELVAAVQRVHDGDVVFSPRLAGFVLVWIALILLGAGPIGWRRKESRPPDARDFSFSSL